MRAWSSLSTKVRQSARWLESGGGGTACVSMCVDPEGGSGVASRAPGCYGARRREHALDGPRSGGERREGVGGDGHRDSGNTAEDGARAEQSCGARLAHGRAFTTGSTKTKTGCRLRTVRHLQGHTSAVSAPSTAAWCPWPRPTSVVSYVGEFSTKPARSSVSKQGGGARRRAAGGTAQGGMGFCKAHGRRQTMA